MTGLLNRPALGAGRRPRPVVIGLAVALTVVVVAVWLVAFSPVLAARSVTVTGQLHRLSAQQIRTAAAVPKGTPLIRLQTAPIRHRLEALKEVASASVRVSYPSTVSITVVERVAVGYLDVGGSYALVDRTGMQFVTATAPPAGLPHFELAPGADARASTMASAQVAAALTPAVLAQLLSISAGSPSAVSLVLRDGRVVRWGSSERDAEKAQLLVPLLKQPGSTFDISDPDSVVVS